MNLQTGWLKAIPVPAFILTTILCLALRENYPFSHFPMYSRMSGNTFYVYVTDQNDEPVPIHTLTSIRTGRLKKIYNSRLYLMRDKLEAEGKFAGFQNLTIEERREAGEYTLSHILERCPPGRKARLDALRPLHFHHVRVKVTSDKAIERTDDTIAKVP